MPSVSQPPLPRSSPHGSAIRKDSTTQSNKSATQSEKHSDVPSLRGTLPNLGRYGGGTAPTHRRSPGPRLGLAEIWAGNERLAVGRVAEGLAPGGASPSGGGQAPR